MSKELIDEYCSECEMEISIFWNIEKDGYKIYCPNCGERLMFCTACRDDGFECDYNSEKDTCRFNK